MALEELGKIEELLDDCYKGKLDKKSVIGVTALLVHAANIDEIYTNHEKDLVKDLGLDQVLKSKGFKN